MSEQENLALGQREVEDGIVFTDEEVQLITSNGLTTDQVLDFVKANGKVTINAAIGGLVQAKPEAEASVASEEKAAEEVKAEEGGETVGEQFQSRPTE